MSQANRSSQASYTVAYDKDILLYHRTIPFLTKRSPVLIKRASAASKSSAGGASSSSVVRLKRHLWFATILVKYLDSIELLLKLSERVKAYQ